MNDVSSLESADYGVVPFRLLKQDSHNPQIFHVFLLLEVP